MYIVVVVVSVGMILDEQRNIRRRQQNAEPSIVCKSTRTAVCLLSNCYVRCLDI